MLSVWLTGIDVENWNRNVKSIFTHGVILCTAVVTFVLFIILFLITIIIIITPMALTFRGGCLRVALAEAPGEMYEDPLSLLGLSHQRKGL